jgi:carboxyl-terminal processing protease
MKGPKFLWITALICGVGFSTTTQLTAADSGSHSSPPRLLVSKLSSEEWSDAFDSLHDQLSTYYAFTEWKQIDWASAYQEYRPRIAEAAANNDPMRYYQVLREYVYEIPDAHVRLIAIDGAAEDLQEDTRYDQIGGSFGFALIELDDGRVVTRFVGEGSAAATAGIEPGAEFVAFDGEPIAVALERVPLTWAIAPPATRAVRSIQRGRYLGRAPVGVTVDVSFMNPGEAEASTATLTAIDDSYETLLFTDLCADLPPDVYSEIIAGAIEQFIDEDVIGVVVDIRTNLGGLDRVAAHLPGHFYTEEEHYEYVSFLNTETGEFEVDPRFTLNTVPQTPYFGGPVVAMTGPCTVSSGEGVAMAIQRLPRGQVVGSYGSYGSFGISGGVVMMPENLVVVYPPGRSLDERFSIQIDSDANLEGGVKPDYRVLLNDDTVRRRFIDGVDVELEAAIDRILNRPRPPRRPNRRAGPAGPQVRD